ncbi:biotin--[acetyl-CoA-carboxylase] ligase [Roseicyclus mahoneyensis]|uniref:biotin--[biotin carboxyl-carrier protein] ligase n=1 Tax=Roseicyclus mahoneyensis TaxID=164332 RepID=A0A316GKC3_9RHOB|nr:biotin--[acetyl-CoA-carboxylase] ligase [Roseicyclus mahoneyensis]PWK61086.1 BirA family biotin operon repressor/biotin-[acetyl-CoA-carboxylase] ligase [Roseicyclus mahoneyensis]
MILQTTDSTMAEAARRAPDLMGPTWICALDQTAARGRRGRPWVNPQGNFAASLVLRPEGLPAQAALRSFVAALALRDALAAVTGRPEALGLKWPNDVLLKGGKVAGILLESTGLGGRIDHLVIGIGVNLVAAPAATEVEPGAVAPVSLAAETGTTIAPEDFLNQLAPAYDRWERAFAADGFAPIRTAWLQGATRLGQTLIARTARDEITGTFTDVDSDGQLVLETAQGPRRIAAADIFF